jgi:hypothetical protein
MGKWQRFFVHGSYAFVRRSKKSADRAKKRAAGENRGPLGMKVKNLQRGTAAAVELGGKSHRVHQLHAIWSLNGQTATFICACQTCILCISAI